MFPISIQKQKKVFSISGGEATESILLKQCCLMGCVDNVCLIDTFHF